MNIRKIAAKNICKNGAKGHLTNDISFESPEVPVKSALPRLFLWADSDKESSHVVGKFSPSEV